MYFDVLTKRIGMFALLRASLMMNSLEIKIYFRRHHMRFTSFHKNPINILESWPNLFSSRPFWEEASNSSLSVKQFETFAQHPVSWLEECFLRIGPSCRSPRKRDSCRPWRSYNTRPGPRADKRSTCSKLCWQQLHSSPTNESKSPK